MGHGHEAAGFEDVVHGAPGAAAVGLGRGAFPREGVAVPAVEGEAAAQFALFTCLFVVVPLRAGFGAFSVVGVGVFAQTEAVPQPLSCIDPPAACQYDQKDQIPFTQLAISFSIKLSIMILPTITNSHPPSLSLKYLSLSTSSSSTTLKILPL